MNACAQWRFGMKRREFGAKDKEYFRQDILKTLNEESMLKNIFQFEAKSDLKRKGMEYKKAMEEEAKAKLIENVP